MATKLNSNRKSTMSRFKKDNPQIVTGADKERIVHEQEMKKRNIRDYRAKLDASSRVPKNTTKKATYKRQKIEIK